MSAPKGNQFAFGNTGGRPRKWNTPADLQAEVDAYFKECDDNPININEVAGKDPVIMKVPTQRPYTIEGLCLHLGCDRRTLLNYQVEDGYEEYFHIITRAKQMITEQMITMALAGGFNASLTKFLLTNNTEYKDKSEVEVSDKRKDIADLFPDELED